MQSRSKLLLCCILIATLASGVSLLVYAFSRDRVIGTELSGENEIEAQVGILLSRWHDDDRRVDALAELQAIMVKLRDGWPGFSPSTEGYRVYVGTPRGTLARTYLGVCYQAAKAPDSRRCELLQVLCAAKPKPDDKELRTTFCRHLERFDIARIYAVCTGDKSTCAESP